MSVGDGLSLYVKVEGHMSVGVLGCGFLVGVMGGIREGGAPLTGADVLFFFFICIWKIYCLFFCSE